MPIVIDEVVISINVENTGAAGRAPDVNTGSNPQSKQQLIQECVEQVMEMLREKEEP